MMSTFVASREFQIVGRGGRSRPLLLWVERPVEEEGVWTCETKSRLLGQEHSSTSFGADAVQALELAIGDLHFCAYLVRRKLGEKFLYNGGPYDNLVEGIASNSVNELIARGRSEQVWAAISGLDWS